MVIPQARARLLIAALLCVCAPACSRHWFRKKADCEAYNAISEKGGYLDSGSIYPGSASRLHDPFSVDQPPLPPDDPASNALMRQVDCKPGYPCWGKFGTIDQIESQTYLQALPEESGGEVTLNLQDAIRVARVNSRSYQTNLETLYVSALNVTLQRFQFDHQFFARTAANQDFRGRNFAGGGASETSVISAAGFQKMSATGGELLIGLANALVWDAWGSNSDVFTSTIDFAIVQPLLRAGGRAVVLERLTQSERSLLANVRQMQQFRQGFYVDIATGRSSGSGPSLGNNVGQNGLGLIAGLPSGRSGAPSAGGYSGFAAGPTRDSQSNRQHRSTTRQSGAA